MEVSKKKGKKSVSDIGGHDSTTYPVLSGVDVDTQFGQLFQHPVNLPTSTLKRSSSAMLDSPSSSGSLKNMRPTTSTLVVLGDRPNGPHVLIDGDPSSITPDGVDKAARDIVGTSNSYDLSELQVESETIIVATLQPGEDGGQERSTKRKDLLSATIDE